MLNNKNTDYATKYKILKGCTLYNFRLENPFKQLEGPRGITPSSTLTDMKYYVCTTGNVVDVVVAPSEPDPEPAPGPAPGPAPPLPIQYSVTTIAGSFPGFNNAIGELATFASPFGVVLTSTSNIVVTDTDNHRIRLITPDSNVTTLAGGDQGFADGTGNSANFRRVRGIAVISNSNFVVADTFNNRIRLVTPQGVVTTIAGSNQGFSNDTGTAARFDTPYGVAVFPNSNIVVADRNNNRIRLVTPQGVVTTIAGNGIPDFVNDIGTTARFHLPSGVAVLSNGNIVVADTNNHRIRLITPNSNVTTLAGSNQGFSNGTGTAARFNEPRGIAVLSNGNIIVADSGNHSIRLVTPEGVVTTIAGSNGGFANGIGIAASFSNPQGVTVYPNGNIVVADSGNNRIRQISIVTSV